MSKVVRAEKVIFDIPLNLGMSLRLEELLQALLMHFWDLLPALSKFFLFNFLSMKCKCRRFLAFSDAHKTRPDENMWYVVYPCVSDGRSRYRRVLVRRTETLPRIQLESQALMPIDSVSEARQWQDSILL